MSVSDRWHYLIAAFVLEESLVLFEPATTPEARYAVLPIAVPLLISVHRGDRGAVSSPPCRRCVLPVSFIMMLSILDRSTIGTPLHHRPQWDQQVSAWRAGRTDHLVDLPYTKAT